MKPLKQWLARQVNPDNLTRIALDRFVRKGQAVVGDHSYGEPRVRFSDGAKLTIGRFCSIADGVQIFLGGNHRIDFVSTYPFHAFRKRWPTAEPLPTNVCSNGDVVIGSDVWMGSNARIMSGITVGHGAILAAGANVTRDVPPYAIVGGNPAKLIRLRFDEATVAGLLETKWWDLSDAQILQLAPLLEADDPQALIQRTKALCS